MKKLLVSLLVLASQQGAFATSIMPSALEFEVKLKGSGKVTQSLKVYVDGQVVGANYGARVPKYERVARLSPEQMNRINHLIRRSTPVITRFERSGARCIMPAISNGHYSASMHGVFLRQGDVCDGGWKFNARPAAQKLVRLLDTLNQAAAQRLPVYQVEERVEALLN